LVPALKSHNLLLNSHCLAGHFVPTADYHEYCTFPDSFTLPTPTIPTSTKLPSPSPSPTSLPKTAAIIETPTMCWQSGSEPFPVRLRDRVACLVVPAGQDKGDNGDTESIWSEKSYYCDGFGFLPRTCLE
jgi:hypothetical protein